MQIEVKEGQEVQEGDVLLILQAMKMNNKLAAPFSGKIPHGHSPTVSITPLQR